jgi:hypothetical protein
MSTKVIPLNDYPVLCFSEGGALDTRFSSAQFYAVEVNLRPELQAKLAHIAAENNSGAEEYVH